jgi:hypothetical protein
MKAFCNRFFFQFSVGFLYGASLAQADNRGAVLIITGAVFGYYLYK